MTTANASCPLAISPATLAAWRDGALSSDESARIATHVTGCEACRQELALYESLDDALRRQPVPRSDGRLWRAVRAGMTSNHRPRNIRRTARNVAGAMGALAAVLLLALGFAQLFQAHGGVTYHPGSTATVVQGTPTPLPTAAPASPAVSVAAPNWQQGNFPTSGITFGDKSDDILTFGVAATDGNIAYACYSQTKQIRQPPNAPAQISSQITIYRTSDRAAHWTQLTQFPLPDIQTSDCTVQVDALDANRVLASIIGQNVRTLTGVQFHELTEDGGATWTRLAYDDGLSYLATANGRTYAIRWQVVGQQSNGQPKYDVHLSVSTDHLRSWRPIDSGLVALGKSVSQVWVRPDGELLVEAATVSSWLRQPSSDRTLLWRTEDSGAHWNLFLLPALGNNDGFGAMIVQQPIAGGQPWRICADTVDVSSLRPTGIVCTLDGGKTWTVRPYLCTSAPCGAMFAQGFAGLSETLTADGSLLMLASDESDHSGLYHLPAHSTQWEYLGPVNGSNASFYAPTSTSGGVIWLFAGGVAVQANLSGVIGGHMASLPSVLLSTATYP